MALHGHLVKLYNLNPKPKTPKKAKPQTPNPKPQTLDPKPYIACARSCSVIVQAIQLNHSRVRLDTVDHSRCDVQ